MISSSGSQFLPSSARRCWPGNRVSNGVTRSRMRGQRARGFAVCLRGLHLSGTNEHEHGPLASQRTVPPCASPPARPLSSTGIGLRGSPLFACTGGTDEGTATPQRMPRRTFMGAPRKPSYLGREQMSARGRYRRESSYQQE